MAQRRIGIEIDDGHVTVVHTSDGLVTNTATYVADDTATALSQAAAAERLDAPTRVSLVARGTGLRRVEITADTVASRAALAQIAFDAFTVNPDAVEVCGLLPDMSDLAGGAVATATVAVSSAEAINETYRILDAKGSDNVEVVPSPFTVTGRDGLHLHVGYGAVEVTLVVDTVPVAFRSLRASGLGRPAAGLGRAEGGWDRVFAALGGASDPIAESELRRWAEEVASETVQTIELWRSADRDIAPVVAVHGPAGTAPVVLDALRAAGLTPTGRDDFSAAFADVAPPARPALVGAYLAASTTGVGSPAAAFPNPQLIERTRARRARKSTMRVAAGVAAALGVVVLAGLGPLLVSRADLAAARDERAAAAAELAAVADTDADIADLRLRAALIDDAEASPRVAAAMAAVIGTAAPGTQFSKLAVTVDGADINVDMNATMPPGDYGQVTGWLDRITTDLSATDVWSPGFSRDADGVTVSATFTLDAADYPLEKTAEGS